MKHKLTHIVSLLSVVLFAVLALGSGKSSGGSGSSSSAPGKVGEALTVDDAEWLVQEAKDMGKSLKPTGILEDKEAKTDGRFIQVKYKITNKGKQPGTVLMVKLVDSQSREFSTWDKQYGYLPKESEHLNILEDIQPSMSRTYHALFEVPADAKGLKLKVSGFGLLAGNKNVDLAL